MRRKPNRRRNPTELTNETLGWELKLAQKFPYKLSIIEHILVSDHKVRNLVLAFKKLGFAFKETRGGSWFDVIKA